MTEQRLRDLRALAADPGATPGEARAARAAAERIAERLRGRERRQRRALRSVATEAAVSTRQAAADDFLGFDVEDMTGAWEDGGPVEAPARVDVSTSRPGGVPTVNVYREYGQRTTQAVPYWCGACGQARNISGACPKCHRQVTEV